MTLTNAHTHLEFTGLSHLCPAEPIPFISWLGRIIRNRQSRTQIVRGIEKGITELAGTGITHVGDISTFGLSIEPLLESGLHGVVFIEILGLRKRRALKALARVQSTIDRFRKHPAYGRMQVGLSLHSPYSCHAELLRQGAAWCSQEEIPLCIHAAESPAETELLLTNRISDLSRPVSLLLKLLRILPDTVPYKRPIPYLASLGVLEAQPIVVHAVQVTDQDIQLLADQGCAVVHCPRSNHALSCGRMPLEDYLAADVNVYLGTDSRASSPNLDVRDEAQFARQLHQNIVPPDQIDTLLTKPFPPKH